MSLLTIKSSLEALKLEDSAIYEDVIATVAEEKAPLKASLEDKTKDVIKLATYKKAMRDGLKFDSEKGSLDDFIIDVNAKIDATSTNEGAVTELSTLKTDFKKLLNRVDVAETAKAKADTIATELKVTADRDKIYNTLFSSLDSKIIAAKPAIKELISDGKVFLAEDGNVAFGTADSSKSLEDGISSYIDEHPELIKSNQQGGSGQSGTGGANQETDSDRITRLRNLSTKQY